jgi:hypothetical protein
MMHNVQKPSDPESLAMMIMMINDMRFEVLTSVTTKTTVSWDVTSP